MTDDDIRAAYKEIAYQIEVAVFHGIQPRRKVWILGVGQNCPSCHGYGHDDGGPGPWRCRICDGVGRLRWLRIYAFEKYLPYDKTHPFAGTKRERKGLV